MPTRPGFDLVPVRKETKEALARLKGDRTYDEVVQALLADASRPATVPRDRARDPEEQIALADLAAKRWRMAVAEGRIDELGPRLVVYWTGRGRLGARGD